MLSSDYLFNMTDEISKLYEELNTSIINDMARRISKMNYVSETTSWQMQRAMESGAMYNDTIKKIAIQTGYSKTVLKKLFRDAGADNWKNNLYKAGLKAENIKLSQNALNLLYAGLNKTNGVLYNLTMTTAKNVQNQFIHAVDLAYSQLTSGAFDYNTVIRRTIKDLATQGIYTVDYKTGYKKRIDSVVRSCVLTGVNQTTGPMTEMQAKEVGANGYETTAHGGARDTHQLWQGKQFYIDVPVKGYEEFKHATGYGTVTGLKGVNCRHDFFWVFLGIDKCSYTKSEIENLNKQTVQYNDKKMTVYEAEQRMREIERTTREWKRQAKALNAAGLDNTFEREKAKSWNNLYKDFSEKTGIKKQNQRLVAYDKEISDKTKDKISIETTKFKKAKSKEEAIKFAFEELRISAGYDNFNLGVANMVNEEIYKIKKDFPDMELFEVSTFPRGVAKGAKGAYSPSSKALYLRNVSSSGSLEILKRKAEEQLKLGFWSSNSERHTIRHELGHALSEKLFKENSSKLQEIGSIMNFAKNNPQQNLSRYGFFNLREFIAESVAEYYNGNARETSKKVMEILLRK